MDLYRQASPIVVDADRVALSVDGDLEGIHGCIPLLVVRSVDQDLVEDLVQPVQQKCDAGYSLQDLVVAK